MGKCRCKTKNAPGCSWASEPAWKESIEHVDVPLLMAAALTATPEAMLPPPAPTSSAVWWGILGERTSSSSQRQSLHTGAAASGQVLGNFL